MMKRNILAVIIPALLVAGAANAAEIYNKEGNKLDLYGKVDALHYFSSNGDEDGDQTYLRMGLKGETMINSQLTGYGQFEYQMQGNQAESDKTSQNHTRLAFAGLKYAEFGSLDYGRNYGVLYDVGAWTDMLPEFGGDSSIKDNFMSQRANNLLTYRNYNFFNMVDGLNFALQYQGKNEGKSGEGRGTNNRTAGNESTDNGDGFGMSVGYDIGWGVSAIGAFSNSNRTWEQKNETLARGNKAETYAGGLKFDANDIYIAAIYSQKYNTTPFGGNGTDGLGTKIANKTQNVEVVAQYQFDFGLRPSIAYIQTKGKNLGEDVYTYNNYEYKSSSKDLVKYVDLGATYYFNKNMSTYVDYKINLLDGNDDFYKAAGIPTDNIVALGLVYQF